MKKAELLAPVGKMENAVAAIENGADALFAGGKLFNARQSADNFTEDELEEIVKYATLRGVKVYVTVNILIKENERSKVYAYLKYLEEIGVHAIIVQDLGIARMAKRYFPRLRLHASTQLSAHSLEDVLFLKSLGFKRVVLAREMQLGEIQNITQKCGIEIETFIHGALCYSYSGQCLMSSLIGGRSGNRGRCAQPCRMRYSLKEDGTVLESERYLLSLKDICSLEFLPELLASGVHSLKIEGRMKSPEYVASVVGIYRKYLDQIQEGKHYQVDPKDLEILKAVFNRGGFSKGYYYERGSRQMLTPDSPRHIGIKAGEVVQYNPKNKMTAIKLTRDLHPGDGIEIIRHGKDSVGMAVTKNYGAGSVLRHPFEKFVVTGSEVYLTKDHELLKKLKATYNRPARKLPVIMTIQGELLKPLILKLEAEERSVCYEGPVLQKAQQNPVTLEKARTQLSKLGATPFKAENIHITWPDQAYIGISELNDARREAVSMLEKQLLTREKDQAPDVYPDQVVQKRKTGGYAACVTSMEQLDRVLQYQEITDIYWQWQYESKAAEEALEKCQQKDKNFYLALPHITKEQFYKEYQNEQLFFGNNEIKGFLVRTMGQFDWLLKTGKALITDYNLNVANSESMSLWMERGAERVTVSVEPSPAELNGLAGNKEKIIYGHLPVMTSSQCILRGTASCQKGKKERHLFELEDRKNSTWKLQTDCKACMMQLLSYQPLALRRGEINEDYIWRFQFTGEQDQEVKHILDSYLRPGFEPVNGTNFKSVL